MDQDIKSQIERAKELLQDLKLSCQKDLGERVVSERTKNLTQEVLIKMRHVLDQAMSRFFEKNIAQTLIEKNKKNAKIYFPIARNHAGLKSTLGRGSMINLEISHPEIFNFLESIQPYNQNFQWLEEFSKFSNEKHIRLTPQEVKEENETTIGTTNFGAVRVGPGGSVKMQNCLINGIPVNVEDLNTAPLSSFDPRLKVSRTTWTSFYFQDTQINILWLCEKSVNDLEKILEEFFSKF